MKKNNWRIKRINKRRKLPIMSKEDKLRRIYVFMMRLQPLNKKEKKDNGQ